MTRLSKPHREPPMTPPEPSVLIFVNGRLVPIAEAHISALDRGFMLGDGLFETMRTRGERVLLLDEHLARLRAGAAIVELPAPPDAALRAAIGTALNASPWPEAVARLTVTRGPDRGRGLEPSPDLTPSVVVRVTPFAAPPVETYRRGVAAVTSHIRRNETSPLSRLKSLNYGDNVLARRAARQRGADEALLLNTRGEAACAAAANLFIVRAGQLLTPPVESGVLAGITRGTVLELAAALGIPARIAPLTAEDVCDAQEAFFTNTVHGVMPLTRLDGQPIGDGTPGTITTALAAAYARRVEEYLARRS